MIDYKRIETLLGREDVREALSYEGLCGKVIEIKDLAQGVYEGKGLQLLVKLHRGEFIFKEHKRGEIEASNLRRKKILFPDNYPQVYFSERDFLLFEYIEGPTALEIVREGKIPHLEQMVYHLAEVHDRSGDLPFERKKYSGYSLSKYRKHLVDIIPLEQELWQQALLIEIEPVLQSCQPVEHVDANLGNWVGLVKIDETNNTLTLPQFSLKSLLEYGPLRLTDAERMRIYGLYCSRRGLDFDEFIRQMPYVDVVFHANKVFRNTRFMMLGDKKSLTYREMREGFDFHYKKVEDATDILKEEGCDVKHIKEFNHSICRFLERAQII